MSILSANMQYAQEHLDIIKNEKSYGKIQPATRTFEEKRKLYNGCVSRLRKDFKTCGHYAELLQVYSKWLRELLDYPNQRKICQNIQRGKVARKTFHYQDLSLTFTAKNGKKFDKLDDLADILQKMGLKVEFTGEFEYDMSSSEPERKPRKKRVNSESKSESEQKSELSCSQNEPKTDSEVEVLPAIVQPICDLPKSPLKVDSDLSSSSESADPGVFKRQRVAKRKKLRKLKNKKKRKAKAEYKESKTVVLDVVSTVAFAQDVVKQNVVEQKVEPIINVSESFLPANQEEFFQNSSKNDEKIDFQELNSQENSEHSDSASTEEFKWHLKDAIEQEKMYLETKLIFNEENFVKFDFTCVPETWAEKKLTMKKRKDGTHLIYSLPLDTTVKDEVMISKILKYFESLFSKPCKDELAKSWLKLPQYSYLDKGDVVNTTLIKDKDMEALVTKIFNLIELCRT